MRFLRTIVAAAAATMAVAGASAPASAGKIPIVWSTAEKVIKVADLPATSEFTLKDGTHLDAGYRYTTFSVLWLPIWDYDHKWTGYVGRDDQYVELSEETLRGLAKGVGVTLPAAVSLPFWDKWGGKLALALGVLAFVGWCVRGRREEAKA
ncbi:MAG: hypothetical protein GC150_03940 [Rhizobiales bacterium]|nr:hypothetical protein [Hyphomicrobiales bacterium]